MILRIVLQIIPTTQNNTNHQVLFYYSPILDLVHFSQVIYELYYFCHPKFPQPSGAVHSIWWLGFFFDLFSYSGLRAFFTSDFTNCTTDYAPPPNYPNHQVLFTASDGWGFFFFFWLFSYSSFILDLEHFSQVIFHKWFYELYYRLCPPQINPTIRCCSQHLMVGVFFFWPLLLFWT